MIRISILILLALGSLRATGKKYEGVKPVALLVEGKCNPYVAVRSESSDEGPIYWLEIQKTITPKSGLTICEKWEYDTLGWGGDPCGEGPGNHGPPVPPHNGTIYGPVCQELCEALEDLGGKKRSFPGPDYQLGLRGLRCPLNPSSIRIPPPEIPDPVYVDHTLVRDYIDVEASIAQKVCRSKNALDTFVKVIWVIFPCKT